MISPGCLLTIEGMLDCELFSGAAYRNQCQPTMVGVHRISSGGGSPPHCIDCHVRIPIGIFTHDDNREPWIPVFSRFTYPRPKAHAP
jgi:hypothetical protein